MQNQPINEIRNIRTDERIAFDRITQYAFGSWTDKPVEDDYLAALNLGECFGSFEAGKLVSGLQNIGFQQSVRGILKPMGGLGAVATNPCYRRKGHVDRLMYAAFDDMSAKGQVVSALWPFRRTFYAAYGYVPTVAVLRVKVNSRAFAPYMAHTKLGDSWGYQRERVIDVREKLTDFLREVAIPTYSSYIIDPDRSDAVWAGVNENTHAIFVEKAGRVEAVARYQIKGSLFDVHEMYWRSLDGRDKLFGYFALHGEQTRTISIPVPEGTSFQRWIDQPDRPFELDLSPAVLMVRIMDVAGGLTGLPAHMQGALTLSVTDEQCQWNRGLYTLSSDGEKLAVEQIEHQPDEQVTHCTIEGLTALAYGTSSLDELLHVGWVTDLCDDAHLLLTNWFPKTLLYNPYFF